MLNAGLKFIWSKKFLLIAMLLLVVLLPNTITRDLQIMNTAVITVIGIDTNDDALTVHAEIIVPTTGEKAPKYEIETKEGTDIIAILKNIEKEMGKEVSLAHCVAVIFDGEPDVAVLNKISGRYGLRSNTAVITNGDPVDLDSEKTKQTLKYNAEHKAPKVTIDDLLRR